MKIQVTQQDIENGIKGNVTQCAIALALNRTTGQQWEVGGCYLNRINDGVTDENGILMPDRMQFFVERFDKGLGVEPFNFKLDMLKSAVVEEHE